jgi:hypothetical protein
MVHINVQGLIRLQLKSFGAYLSHPFLVGGVEKVRLLLLLVGSVLDVHEGELDGDGDVLDAGDIEISSF